MATLVGLIYDSQSLALLAVVVPENDWELSDSAYNRPGWTNLGIPLAVYQSATGPYGAQALVPGWKAPA